MAKIRAGFVSNSSSSSFILPLNSVDDKVQITVSLDDLKRSFEDSDESRIYEVVKTVEQLDAYYIDTYGWKETNVQELFKEEDHLEQPYNEHLEILKSGKIIVFGAVGYGDSLGLEFLKQMGATIEN
jgi:hypothetical protein